MKTLTLTEEQLERLVSATEHEIENADSERDVAALEAILDSLSSLLEG